jgi:hypothetical protein
MITIPLFVFLICYLAYLLLFIIFSVANVYHLISTGTFTFAACAVTAFTAAWCALVLIFTYVSLAGMNWHSNLILFGPGGFMLFQ